MNAVGERTGIDCPIASNCRGASDQRRAIEQFDRRAASRVPVNVGVATLVILSAFDGPPSLAAVRSARKPSALSCRW